MHEESMSLADIQRAGVVEEEMGYDAPFVTFTWERWQAMQAQMLGCFTRFQRAIDKRQTHLASTIAMEMQEVAFELQKEACAWIGIGTR